MIAFQSLRDYPKTSIAVVVSIVILFIFGYLADVVITFRNRRIINEYLRNKEKANRKVQIYYGELLEHSRYTNSINELDLSQIELIGKDGLPVELTADQINDFRYMGLSNIHYIKILLGIQ